MLNGWSSVAFCSKACWTEPLDTEKVQQGSYRSRAHTYGQTGWLMNCNLSYQFSDSGEFQAKLYLVERDTLFPPVDYEMHLNLVL